MNNKYNKNKKLVVATSLSIVFLMIILFFIQKNQNLNESISTTSTIEIIEEEELENNKENEVQQAPPPQAEENISVAQKKQNFLDMIVPALNIVYEEELELFYKTKEFIEINPNDESLISLRDEYNAKNNLELLMALKPHPKSITIAQGAIESAWGTSRFFKEANNIFGVWSFNKNEPRIAAGNQRDEKTIWLKKYATVEDAIRDYYMQLSRSWAFEDFRKLNYEVENQNPYLLVEKLERYSEKRGEYTKELSSMISFNDFTKFDPVQYERVRPKSVQKEQTEVSQEEVQKEEIVEEKQESIIQENEVQQDESN